MQRKPIFDALRRFLGRGFKQAEVKRIDSAIDQAVKGIENDPLNSVPCVTSAKHAPRQIGPNGIALIKQFEGCGKRRGDGLFEAYPDPGTGGDPWTIGWGATGPNIQPGTVWTQSQCDDRLESDLARYAAEVAFALEDRPTTQAQFDALVSFHYNTGAIAKATLTRKHKAGDHAGAAREFDRWCRAGGRIMKGLVRRRAAESALYRTGS